MSSPGVNESRPRRLLGVNDMRLGPLPEDLRGRRAVVTGAASGIGRGIAARLVRCGALVVAVDSDEGALRATASALGCDAVVGDLSRLDTATLAEELGASYGPIELIVNNVGISTAHGFLDLQEADFDRVLHTNLRGPWFFTRRLVERLIAEGRPGSIVFISSLHDAILRLQPHYSATKAAVAMLTKELAYEVGRHGIRVNAVSPGSIRSATNPQPNVADPAISRLIPAGRSGDPDDVAKVVAVLLSDAWSGYVTGANVPVDGGLALHSWLMDP